MNKSLSADFKHHFGGMLKQVKCAKDDSEAFQSIVTALVMLAHEYNVDPHEFVTMTQDVHKRVAAELGIEQ